VSYFIEWRNFDELAKYFDTIVAFGRQDSAKSLEHLLAQLAEAVPLGTEPILEQQGPIDR
jgi:hypothetical protein